MITIEERQKIADLFHIGYPLDAEIYRSQADPAKIYHIRYFWIATIFTFNDRLWNDVMIAVIRDADDYYGVLTSVPWENDKMYLDTLKPIKLPNWTGSVGECFHNLDVLVDESSGTIFGSDGINLSIMLSSRSITTNIEIRRSMEIRPSINNLATQIANTIRYLVKQCNDDKVTELLFGDMD